MPNRGQLPSYETPPVIEVVYGVAFNELDGLKAPHTGIFWSLIRDSYPKVQHAAPAGPFPRDFDVKNLPLPRIWFISQDENFLVQLQADRFLFNWRTRSLGDEYPRFDIVQSGFHSNFAIFSDFVESNGLGELTLRSYELTYVNHIPRSGRYERFQKIGSLFPDLRWRTPTKRYLPAPSHLTWSVGFEFGDAGRLTAELKPAIRRLDDQALYVLELKATGQAHTQDPTHVAAWFAQAHEWIVRGFADLTSETAQTRLWGLHGTGNA